MCTLIVCIFLRIIWPALIFTITGGSEKLLRVCLNLPYFLRYINRFQDAVSANSFFIMPATVADATAVRNGYIWISNWKIILFYFNCKFKSKIVYLNLRINFFSQISFIGDRCDHGFGHTLPASTWASDTRTITRYDCAGFKLSLCR